MAISLNGLIVAMLILIYKHANAIGYKTAKRRFTIEMRNLIIAMIVVECRGDPCIILQNIKKWSEFLPTTRDIKPPSFIIFIFLST